jgi:internalin A
MSTALAELVSRPWRRFLRFSVRALFVLVLVFGAELGWIVHEAHVQRDAVAAIKKAGGFVKYDWEWRDGKNISGAKPWAPRLVVDHIGVDYFGHVFDVNLSGSSRPADTTLAEIGRLNQLRRLWLNDASVTDVGLANLKGLTNLSTLGLGGAQITDAGLAHLKGLPKLSSLGLNGTQVTDAGLAHLKGLTKLSYLMLDGTPVTDAGMSELKRTLPSLTIYH